MALKFFQRAGFIPGQMAGHQNASRAGREYHLREGSQQVKLRDAKRYDSRSVRSESEKQIGVASSKR
jgi:hypothetical protein